MFYLRFCSTIYHFYISKDSHPVIYTFWASTAVITANLIAIYNLIGYFVYPALPFSKTVALTFLGIVGLLNYLIVICQLSIRKLNPNQIVEEIQLLI